MSIDSLPRQKSLKRERVYELQKRYVSSFSHNDHISQYNALQDKYTFHYFNRKPVKKHLKRLAKAINLEPLTTQNQKILNSLNEIIIHPNPSQPNLKQQHLTEIGAQSNNKQNITKKELAKKRMNSYSQIDPYIQTIKTNSIEKLKKLRFQTQKHRNAHLSTSNNDLDLKVRRTQSKSLVKNRQPLNGASQREISSVNNQKKRQAERIEILNQTKHQRLIDFIKKKKKLIKIMPSQQQDKSQQQYLNQDFQEQKQ